MPVLALKFFIRIPTMPILKTKMIIYILRKNRNTRNPDIQDNSGLPLEKSVTYCQLQFDAFFVCCRKQFLVNHSFTKSQRAPIRVQILYLGNKN